MILGKYKIRFSRSCTCLSDWWHTSATVVSGLGSSTGNSQCPRNASLAFLHGSPSMIGSLNSAVMVRLPSLRLNKFKSSASGSSKHRPVTLYIHIHHHTLSNLKLCPKLGTYLVASVVSCTFRCCVKLEHRQKKMKYRTMAEQGYWVRVPYPGGGSLGTSWSTNWGGATCSSLSASTTILNCSTSRLRSSSCTGVLVLLPATLLLLSRSTLAWFLVRMLER